MYPNNKMLDTFLDVISHTLLDVSEEPGWRVWPMPFFHPSEGNFYLAVPERSFIVELYEHIKCLEEEGLSDKDIAKLFKKPSRIATLTFLFEWFRHSKLSPEQRVELAIKLLRYIKCLKKEDPFCTTKRNILLSNEEVNNLISTNRFLFVRDHVNLPQLVGRLNAALFLLCETMYFLHHSIGHEFHGPYYLNNGKIILIREYYDLKNTECWDFTKKLSFNELTTIEIYKGVDIRIDFFNRMRSSQSLPHALVGVCVKQGNINAPTLNSPEDIKSILNELLEVLKLGQESLKSLDKKGMIRKYVEVHYFIRKPLTEKLGIDWYPPGEVYEFLERVAPPKEIAEMFKKMSQMPRERQLGTIKQVFDPRVNKVQA